MVNKVNFMFFYDKYAGVMYFSILRLTDNAALANEILTETFIELKSHSFFLKTKFSLISLIQFTCCVGIKYLADKKIPQKAPDQFAQTYPILYCVLYGAYSLKQAAILYSVSVDDVKKRLHDECEMLKNLTELSL